MYEVSFSQKAEKELAKLNPFDSKKIINKLLKLSYPFPENFDIKKIVGVEGFYRLRVGKARVIFEIDFKAKVIWIRKVGYRKDIYRF